MKKAITIILVCIAILASLLLIVGCTQTHTHSYVQKKATKEYLLSAATFTEKARYFYSCECGAMCPDVFEYGDYADHPYSDEWSKDETTHWHQSTCIHNVKSDEAEHNFANNTCTVCKYVTTKEHDEYAGFTFLLNGDSYTLTKYSGTKTTVTIPSSYSGKPVTIIGNSAFLGCVGLTSIIIPDSITSIGYYAFQYCGLTSVTIGSGVTFIGEDAFLGCSGLTHIVVSKKNPKYHSEGNCLIETSTKTLVLGCQSSTIPADGSVTSIGSGAFQSCTGLASIALPDSVMSIGNKAFALCTSLIDVKIGSGVVSIGRYAFSSCNGLMHITVSKENPQYHSDGNCLIETTTKTLVVGCKSSIIPNDGSVTAIGSYAFYGCTGLASMAIPDNITSIGYSAFAGCTSLTSVTIGIGVTSIEDSAFARCGNLASIIIGSGVTFIGEAAFGKCTGLTTVNWNATNCTTNVLRDGIFENCPNLSTVVIGKNVQTIPPFAFLRCAGIKSIAIPDSVTSIGYSAFSCTGLTSITIPDSVISIDGSAFHSCLNLTSAIIGSRVESIGGSAFRYCTGLTNIIIPDSVISIGEAAFV